MPGVTVDGNDIMAVYLQYQIARYDAGQFRRRISAYLSHLHLSGVGIVRHHISDRHQQER